jgi:hypothetical protein
VHKQRLKGSRSFKISFCSNDLLGFLNKAEKKGNSLSVSDGAEPEAVKQAFIEEVKE